MSFRAFVPFGVAHQKCQLHTYKAYRPSCCVAMATRGWSYGQVAFLGGIKGGKVYEGK